MPQATGYVLRLDAGRLDALENELSLSGRFAEPVAEFDHSRQVPLVCIVTDDSSLAKFVARARRGFRAGTGLRRLNLFDIKPLVPPDRLLGHVESVPIRHRSALRSKLTGGGLLTPNQFTALVDAAQVSGGALAELLRRYSTERQTRILALPNRVREQLAYQKEAVGTALLLAGFDRRVLHDWEPPVEGGVNSFLSGLPQARVREDPMIINDLATIPGFTLIGLTEVGAAVFDNHQGDRLTVVLANRQPLEELTGADLIYYHEIYHAFVMVQYKAMDRLSNGDAIFRLPSDQLDDEIHRMDALLASIRELGAPQDASGFRLAWNPFFLKLCPRLVFDPDNTGLTRGMYLPLDNWKLLAESPAVIGQRGGRGITFGNAGRHFDNTSFMALVSQAWVGTTPAQSQVIGEAVRSTIESGRAAVIAVRRQSGGLAGSNEGGDSEPMLDENDTPDRWGADDGDLPF